MTHAMNMAWRFGLLRLLAVALMIVLGGYQAAATIHLYEQLRWPEGTASAGVTIGPPWPSVTGMDGRAAASGLAVGDKISHVQGRPFMGRSTVDQVLEKMFPGDRIRLTVRSAAGEPRDVSWQLGAANGNSTVLARILFSTLVYLFMPFLCLVVGFRTVLARPREVQAWLLLAMLASFAHSVVHPGPFPSTFGSTGAFFQLLHAGMSDGWALAMLLFAWQSPPRAPWQRWQVWPLAAMLAASVVAMVLREALVAWGDPVIWGSWTDTLTAWRGGVRVLQMVGITCFFALLFHKGFATLARVCWR